MAIIQNPFHDGVITLHFIVTVCCPKWIDSATGLPNFSRHTTANLETRTIAGAELYYEGFYGSIVAAAKALGVPYKRLYYRVNGHHSTAENGGNRALLDSSDEEEVFCGAHRRITQGHHIQGRALQQHANAILKAKGVELQHREPGPSALYSGIENSSTVEEQQRETSNGRLCKIASTLDDDTIISTSQKGYINDVIAIEWIKHFEKHTRPVDPLQKRLLLMDSCDNHYTEEMVHFCFDHNIKVFPMPPHLTHQLQPLDVGVFRSYKHWHQQVLHREIADGAYDFNKSDFLYHLQELQDTLSSLTEEVAIKDLPGSIESEPQGGPQAARPSTPSPHTPPRFNDSTGTMFQRRDSTSLRFREGAESRQNLALNGITATAEMTKIKEKQAKRSSLQQQTTIVARYGPLSDGDARIRVARDEYNRQAAQEEEAQRVRNKEVRDEAGYIRRWLRKVRFNVRISITEAKIRDIRGLWAKGDKRAHLNCNEWMCASYRILRELHNRGVGQSKAIMWPEYYDREIVKEAAELVVMEANKRAICRQTLSLEADGIEMR
ncbi:DDE superfamily endonuclease domain-containing protein [Hirsutella rhossiliensis]|uniref:DDE superfamily endonuclease domain-containing protein n=1 Tax=Hirsutella rhossiliensis TaxID=111463 RepID=A0A9P8MYB8_9HYPO|nr:DDE superfamily endonuclease domain-containing protein [Hirsutella rhossiliensis]KAH0962531.1 DDE superfamily endonuclease domain-containing protein [Hirsutella rhossiliensis]